MATPASGVLGAWAIGALVLVGTLSGAHLLTLPAPSSHAKLASALAAGAPAPGWAMTHVLRAECRCSQRIATHLARRGANAGARERVLLLGDDPSPGAGLRAAGFTVEAISEEDLGTRFGIEAVPILIVTGPEGDVRYVGGYSARKQGPVIADLAVLRALRGGESVEALPLFGCAASPRLRKSTDPFGLR